MKGDYVKEENDNRHSNPMFAAKLHQTQKFQHQHHTPPPAAPPPQSQPTTLVPHSFNPQECQTSVEADSNHRSPTTLLHHSFNPRECQTSVEADSNHRSPTTPSTTKTQIVHLQTPSSGNDGATIEVVRRPRGRPPGSKNKPKPPVIITRDAEPSMSPYILEIPSGIDILETITTFSRKRNTGLCILNGSGTVSNVSLRQPSTTPGASVTFHGRFDILSLSATILPSNPHSFSSSGSAAALSSGIVNGFTIFLAGPQGQVVGGTVMGSLFTASTVYLIATSFNSPSFHRLPLEDDERDSGSAAAGTAGGCCGGIEGPTVSGGADGGRSPAQATGGGVDSLYSCHLPSDLIWAPGRQPQQHLPPY